jgi:hypothetical protein
MIMRVLSISSTLRLHSSARRMPVGYSVISMARWEGLLAESIIRQAAPCPIRAAVGARQLYSRALRAGGTPGAPGQRRCQLHRQKSAQRLIVDAEGLDINELVEFVLASDPAVGRPAVDRTGLTAAFNFHLEFPPAPAGPPTPPVDGGLYHQTRAGAYLSSVLLKINLA